MKNHQPIKVFVLPSWYPPEGGQFFADHSRALAREGMDVTVLAVINIGIRNYLKQFFSNKKVDRNNSEFAEIRENCLVFPVGQERNVKKRIEATVRLYENAARKHGHPDVLQVHSSIWAGAAASVIKGKYGTPYVLTEHRSRFIENSGHNFDAYSDFQKNLVIQAFTHSDQVVAVSEELKTGIEKWLRENELSEISVIPNMVDTDFFTPAEGTRKEGTFTFFFLGNFEYYKGADVLIEAFRILMKEYEIKCRLIIGGDSSGSSAVHNLVKKYDLEEKVCFTGRLSDKEVRSTMQQSDAFVLPSRYEAFGVVLLEAMACGLPVVATRSGGPENFVPNHAGILTEPENPEKLAQAMNKMLKEAKSFNPEVISEYIRKNFSAEVIAARYKKLYENILKKQG